MHGKPRCARSIALPIAGGLLVFLPLAGCGESNAIQATQTALQTAQRSVAEATGASEGSIDLTIGSPFRLERCIARFKPQAAGRPAVLQLTSYESPEKEEFPSVLLWATADVPATGDLAGKTLSGHLFVQRDINGELWATPPQHPILITVVEANLLSLTCEIKDATIEQHDGAATAQASGKFVGIWK